MGLSPWDYLWMTDMKIRGDYLLTVFREQIVNPKGEMKGSAITGPVGKEAAELWPVSPPCLFCATPYFGDRANRS